MLICYVFLGGGDGDEIDTVKQSDVFRPMSFSDVRQISSSFAALRLSEFATCDSVLGVTFMLVSPYFSPN